MAFLKINSGIIKTSSDFLRTNEGIKTLFGNLAGDYKWVGGVLAPNGKIYGIPLNSAQILEIDPIAQTTSSLGH